MIEVTGVAVLKVAGVEMTTTTDGDGHDRLAIVLNEFTEFDIVDTNGDRVCRVRFEPTPRYGSDGGEITLRALGPKQDMHIVESTPGTDEVTVMVRGVEARPRPTVPAAREVLHAR